MIYNYFIGLGSNIEPRVDYIIRAGNQLEKHGKILKKSNLYLSEAWGNKNQAEFINGALEFESALEPHNLLHKIKNIEIFLGRQHRERWGPREIDIDILFCRNLTVDLADLQIPHPRFRERRFVLVPMAELNKDLSIPPHNRTISYFLDTCTDQSYIKKLESEW